MVNYTNLVFSPLPGHGIFRSVIDSRQLEFACIAEYINNIK
jgi:hypothetical protein